jgi:hypothetical protein
MPFRLPTCGGIQNDEIGNLKLLTDNVEWWRLHVKEYPSRPAIAPWTHDPIIEEGSQTRFQRSALSVQRSAKRWTWDGTVEPGLLPGKCSYTAHVRATDGEQDDLWALLSTEGAPSCWMVASDHPDRAEILAFVPIREPRPLPPVPHIGAVLGGWRVVGPAE